MKRYIKYLIIVLFFIGSVGLFAHIYGESVPTIGHESALTTFVDTIPIHDSVPRFPVKRTRISSYEDLKQINPIDLKDPENLKTETDYDPRTGYYMVRTKLGDADYFSPLLLTFDEYSNYTLSQSMGRYFRKKNAMAFETGSHKFDDYVLKDVPVFTNPLDRAFGPGGLKFRINGYAETKLGVKNTRSKNPTLSQRNRNRTTFDIDEDIQLNVKANVGEKVNFDLNYDTKAAFDFDSKKIKLGYGGDEDEIIKKIEAGNVSMATTNSLINGGTDLFGINAELQFGKLHVNTIVAQQESESRTINTQGSIQKTAYEFKAADYDENRHFFLGQYFRDHYDEGMSHLPSVLSKIKITRIEVWVTNKSKNFDQSRNIVAFADLGEHNKIKNTSQQWAPTGTLDIPYNGANNLYHQITSNYAVIRDVSKVNNTLPSTLIGGKDYEKVEKARLLSPTEYSYNAQLGYISLSSALQSDEVLAAAFEYQYQGATYQVGEFSGDITDQYNASNNNSGALFLKLLKPVSLSPQSYTWDLMMKNVYNLGAGNIEQEGFRLQISYLADSIGTYITYLPEGNIKNQPLLNVMNLDRLDSRGNAVKNSSGKQGDGIFDFVEGYTIKKENGRIYFPVIEPFGEYLEKKIGSPAIAQKYVYKELYTSTKTTALEEAEKNKFKIYGSYRGNRSSGATISLNATNVPKGSVRVLASGVALTEGVDYLVDYLAGTITIINQNILESNTPVSVSLEDRSFTMQRKTLLGLNLSYEFSKNFNIGATVMHLSEKPLVNKTTIGNEAVRNTLWGVNMAYNTQSQWLTDVIDKIPFVEATQPSHISLSAEYAKMEAGHYNGTEGGGYSYLDDFESSESRIDLKNPYGWALASTPTYFSEAKLSNDIEYGKNRAMMSWFMIDGLFTRKGSANTPQHIRNDKDQLSNHFVREITINELYPNRDISFDDTGTIPALNISYYPSERGPYNLDAININSDGKLLRPETRWGGITRKMDVRDFESTNIEYIEFWLMDPFVYNDTAKVKNDGGEFIIDLGEISEDVLKDGKKFFENGLPINGDLSAIEYTVWGKVPKRQAVGYSFDNEVGTEGRKKQDVGLNGLSTEEELQYSTYANYLAAYKSRLSASALTLQTQDPFSPLNDPAGDTYHYYKGAYYDEHKTSILDRYKYYNGTEGNSPVSSSEAARNVPDVEDIDQDNTMNENESYFQYKMDLRPSKMKVGQNYIVEERVVPVDLRNGKRENIKWYQFKIPVRNYANKYGMINDFKSIRFMRMFMTNFKQTTFLRFGTLQLVRGDWRKYDKTLNAKNAPSGGGKIDVTRVNLEENSTKEPVNYIMPPGLNRSKTANQTQLLQDNEQSLSIMIRDLDIGDARAVYKNTNYDLRRYKRLQMFVHAEELIGGGQLNDGDFSVFLRLGSDMKDNYYEYEIPVRVTPAGKYSAANNNDRETVWPTENMFNFSLDVLKDLKLERNKEKRKAGSTVSYTSLYSKADPGKPANMISIIGNPSLADVYVIMIGVRNNSSTTRSGEIWVNELRLTDFDDKGGWAAQGNLNIAFSDIGTLNLSGRKETVGFGALDQKLLERRSNDYSMYNISLNMDLGRFIPKQAQLSIPFYYAYSEQRIKPEYDPFNTDVKLEESVSSVDTKAEKDSIRGLAIEYYTTQSISFTNVKSNIKSKTPMPYDPANLSFTYAYNQSNNQTPVLEYDKAKDYKLSMQYTYSPDVKSFVPFKKVKGNSGASKFAKSLEFNYVPNNISFNSVMSRYYTETLTRDLESYYIGGTNDQKFLTWSQTFYWDRDFSLNWDFTRNLKMSFLSGTRAEIEEPYLQVNKNLNRDDYDRWKDTVWHSIRHLGDPLSYRQSAKLTYQLPFTLIPALNWAHSDASYSGNYQWDKGANVGVDSLEVGNVIKNQMTLDIRNRLDLTALYRKNSFLKKVNDRFDGRRRNLSADRRQRRQPQSQNNKRQSRYYVQQIKLRGDSVIDIKHGLNSKKINITALNDGKAYKLKYKRIDENTIRITNNDTVLVRISIETKNQDERSGFWNELAEYSARGLMSVRSVGLNYSTRKETYIAGFKPTVGDMFGQKKTSSYGMVPGIGFAFGFDGGEDYINKAYDRDWLLMNEYSTTPAIYTRSEKLELRAQIEPIKGLKIELNANREKSDRTEIQYMYDGKPRLYGGSFSMTTIALSSAFDVGNAKNGYKSKAFQKFLNNRQTVKNRMEKRYANTNYPNAGFIATDNTSMIGNPYVAGSGNPDVNPNSADVLIPAFLSAYTGKNANKISLSAFPSLWKLLPNWTMSYDGLSDIPLVKKYFKSIRLNHAYNCFYQIGSYNSFSTWVAADNGGDGLGYIRDVLSGKPVPSSPYNISSVSIAELFNPLFGVEAFMNNNLSFNMHYNNARTLNLNIASAQIIESIRKEWIVGTGYRINNFNRVLGLKTKPANGVNNDLNLKMDLSHATTQALIRRIEENYTQATSGITILTLKLTAAYSMNRSFTFGAFFDHIINKPLVTSAGYQTTNSNIGISLKFTLQP